MKNKSSWLFLLGLIIIYFITLIFKPSKFYEALSYFSNIMLIIFPIFVLILILMVLINYFVKTKRLIKILGKNSGIKGYVLVIISGIISSGPIYIWYPLLKNLNEKGMKKGLIATFLYCRSIKIPLLPLLILYFGLPFTIIFNLLIIIGGIAQGIIFDIFKIE